MGARVDIADAIRHLRARVAKIETADSRHRPHWTQADLDAVAALVDIPASAEQIALARIEGITWNGNSYDSEARTHINRLARKALGIGTVLS